MENSERALVHLVCGGDSEAYWRLVQPHLHAVLAAARAILGNQADAEEVAQESVLKALGRIQKFRGDVRFSTWLIQITINEARNRLRKGPRHLFRSWDEWQTSNGDEYFPRDFKDWRDIPSEALERKELRDALQQALASLPQEYRAVFTLRDIAHLSIDETAQVLGLTRGSVKARLLRARLRMRDALAPGLDDSWFKSSVGPSLCSGKAEVSR